MQTKEERTGIVILASENPDFLKRRRKSRFSKAAENIAQPKVPAAWLDTYRAKSGSSNKMSTIVAATKNKHKIREIEQITKEFGMDIITRAEAGIPDEIEIDEDGTTFEENSYKKAYGIMKLCGQITIADDSGIEVDCLDKAPGVYSARYAGVDGESADRANNDKLMEDIKDFPYEERTGRFVSVITMVFPDGEVISARGEVEGHVIPEERGPNGFGYDPMFIPLGYDITFGEFDPEEKNKISHRANALVELRRLLQERAAK